MKARLLLLGGQSVALGLTMAFLVVPVSALFLDEYGAHDLDADHLEFALLARGLRDLSARVVNEVDRPGVDTWGFDRITRVDSNLETFRPYCG